MRKILAGRVYRHFKGKDYKVLVVAQHTETGEQCVVYQALYDDLLPRWIVKSIPRWSSNTVLS